MITTRTNDLIYEAISKLEQLLNSSFEIISKEQNYDALVKIRGEQFVLETKTAIRTSNQGLILSQLEKLRQQSKRPIIVIADFIAKDATKILKERNINYIDTSGNAYINHNDLAILIEGQKMVKKERTNQSRAFQESGLKILFYLLINPEHLHHPYRKIAEKVDVSLGSVSQVMAELEDLNYLLKAEGKRILKKRKKIIRTLDGGIQCCPKAAYHTQADAFFG